MNGYHKRFYTPKAFLKDFWDVVIHLPDFRRTSHSRRVSRAFAEKIMLVITAVNDCRYCSFGHTRMALRSGIHESEIQKLLGLELDGLPLEQAVALAFAQHYAETARRPDPQVEKHFYEYYGPQVSQDIMNWMRMILLGNLSGNTADAFLSRLNGRPAHGSSFWNELVLFLLFAPVILPLLGIMRLSR